MLIMLIYKPYFFNYLDIKGDAQEQCDLINNEVSRKHVGRLCLLRHNIITVKTNVQKWRLKTENT